MEGCVSCHCPAGKLWVLFYLGRKYFGGLLSPFMGKEHEDVGMLLAAKSRNPILKQCK